ncbi:hypothetical protein I4U23_013712 [Adineta vaga]|nr:hypothetical protein I4U23_013712 [Adineta vaga]
MGLVSSLLDFRSNILHKDIRHVLAVSGYPLVKKQPQESNESCIQPKGISSFQNFHIYSNKRTANLSYNTGAKVKKPCESTVWHLTNATKGMVVLGTTGIIQVRTI